MLIISSERQELIRTLQSLYALKVTRMLVKRPPGKDVDPSDKFIWNGGFTREDRVKFKINQLQQDMTASILHLAFTFVLKLCT